MESVTETKLTVKELHQSLMFRLYLSSFSPIVGLHLFSSSRAVSQYFKDKKSLMQIYKWCHIFGPSIASHVLLHNRKFYISTTMLDPTLWLQLNDINENDCRKFFRFSHSEIKQLIVLLQLPEVLTTPVHHDHVLVVEAFCLLLHCLSYPYRWFDLQKQFC